MTDRPGTAESNADSADTVADPTWSVDGWEPAGDGGLSDTVVRMPKIVDERPVKPKKTANTGAAASETTASVPAEAPSEWAVVPPAEARTQAVGAVPPPPPPSAGPSLPPPPPVEAAVVSAAAATPTVAPAAAASAAAPRPKSKSGLHRTRKARLRLSRIDPWSVMKTSFLFSIAFGIMFWVATWMLWTVVIQSGLFEAINTQIVNIIQNPTSTTSFRIEDYVNTNKVLGIAALLAVVNVVISTALGTLFAFLYNLSANVLGGLELTLAED